MVQLCILKVRCRRGTSQAFSELVDNSRLNFVIEFVVPIWTPLLIQGRSGHHRTSDGKALSLRPRCSRISASTWTSPWRASWAKLLLKSPGRPRPHSKSLICLHIQTLIARKARWIDIEAVRNRNAKVLNSLLKIRRVLILLTV